MNDNISRQAAIDVVNRPICPTGDATYDNAREAERESIREELEQLLSTDRKGHWIVQDTSYWRATPAGDVPVNRVNLKCSCCGYRLHYTKIARKYCPECGADMRGERNE